MNESGALVDGALAARLAAEEPIDAAHSQARDVLGRRHDAVGGVLVGIQPRRGEIVAQLHRLMALLERHREHEALPLLRVAIVLVLVGEHERVAVLIEDGQNLDRLGGAADPRGHRQRDRHDLLRHVELAVDHLVANEIDAGDLLERDLQSLFGVTAELLSVNQGRGAGDRQKADVEPGFLERLALLRDGFESVDRQDARERAQKRAGAHRAQQGSPQDRFRKQAVQQCRVDAARHRRLGRSG